jgi:hypothetical protein
VAWWSLRERAVPARWYRPRENCRGHSTKEFALPTLDATTVLSPALAAAPWWVQIERQDASDLAVGPYPNETAAELAMSDALLIDGFCEQNALDCFVTDIAPSADVEQVIIDLDDPHHTGQSEVTTPAGTR